MDLNFQHYLSAKRTVDDRALNRWVWTQMSDRLLERQSSRPVSVVEIGAGIGTMFQRLVEWGALHRGRYTLLDAQDENISFARTAIASWALALGFEVSTAAGGSLCLRKPGYWLQLSFEPVDLHVWMGQDQKAGPFDMLVAHAVLDLFDIPKILPGLIGRVAPGGLCYLTLNFDGDTIFEPVSDPHAEERIIRLYHRSMDERITGGARSGDSRAGRHLFRYLQDNASEIIAAGSSDWVVYPHAGGYPADETYFLQFILHFFEESLGAHPDSDPATLQRWLAERRRQVDQGELVYLAHQIDFLASRIF